MPTTILGFSVPTLGEIVERVLDDLNSKLPNEDARIKRSEPYALGTALSGGLKGVYGFIKYIGGQILPDRATGEFLTRWASLWGIDRIAAAFAAGDADGTGTNGVVVPAGTLWQLTDGSVQYEQVGPETIAGGVFTVNVLSQTSGTVGNAAAGVTLELVDALAGVDSQAIVSAGTPITGGQDVETDAALQTRLVSRIRNPPQGGAIADYDLWVRQAIGGDGVNEVWVTPNETGLGTVGVRFSLVPPTGGDASDAIPAPADITAAQTEVDAEKPVTAIATVYTLTGTGTDEHDMSIKLTPSGDPDVQAQVTAEINALYLRDGEPGGTIYLSNIRGAIDAAPDEQHHEILLIDGAPPVEAAIVTGTNGLPTVGVITYT